MVLLNILNKIWSSGDFPESWREATVIPLPKAGKNPSDPSSYRPIALTSCLCKTMERMINTRLVWYLESNNIINKYQSGFRKGRSTTDHLIRLESTIRDAFLRGEHVVSGSSIWRRRMTPHGNMQFLKICLIQAYEATCLFLSRIS